MRMAKAAVAVGLTALISGLWGQPAAASSYSVQVNGSPVPYESSIVNGRVMVPIAALRAFKNVSLSWNNETKLAVLKRGSTVIRLTAGSRTATVNGRTVAVDAPVEVRGGRIMAPFRLVAEALGAKVTVDGATGTVRIQDTAGGEAAKDGELPAQRAKAVGLPTTGDKKVPFAAGEEPLSRTYYFPEGRADRYLLETDEVVYYYVIRDSEAELVWAAKLDRSSTQTKPEITRLFGHPAEEEYGKAPALASRYAYFSRTEWSGQVAYGLVGKDGEKQESGTLKDWTGSRFIVAIPEETVPEK